MLPQGSGWRVLRQRETAEAWIFGAFFTTMTLFGLKDIEASFRWVYLSVSALMIYSRFVRAGVFSLLDLVAWFCPLPPIQSGRRDCSKPCIRIEPDQPVDGVKTGIVLAGGGGKGAYQIGCWKALLAHHISPQVIVGTSAGALNVAMMAQGEVQTAEDVWSSMSASRLVALDLASLPFLPFVASRLRWHPTISPGMRAALNLVPIPSVIGLAAWGWYLLKMSQLASAIGGSRVVLYATIALFWLFFSTILGQIVLRYLSLATGKDKLRPLPSLFRTSGLRRLIEALVPAGTFLHSAVDSYVTVGLERKVIDPYYRFDSATRRSTELPDYLINIKERPAFLPRYVSLGDEEREKGVAFTHLMLTASSALPVLFPVLQIGDWWIADGGTADNLPIKALLDKGCTRIFVIHLDHRGRDHIDGKAFDVLTKEGLLEKLKWQERLERLDYYYPRIDNLITSLAADLIAQLVGGDPVLKPDYKPELSAQVIHVVPSLPLGNLLTGTLNFTSRKARWLIKLGECDMNAALASIGCLISDI